MDDIKNSRLQSEVNGLSQTIKERDAYIEKLSGDLIELQSKNMELEAQLAAANNERTAEQFTKQPAKTAAYVFTESRDEIISMEETLKKGLTDKQVDSIVITELADLRLKRDLAENQLAEKTTELAQAKSTVTTMQLENTDLKERLLQQNQLASKAQNELEVIQQRTNISFTASELAGYMSRAIDDFNHEANTGDLSVNYIINDMDVTFRASLTKNVSGEMTLAAPSLSGSEESFSVIKFIISAIPKEPTEAKILPEGG